MANTRGVSIPEELAEKIEKKIKGTNFSTLSDYVVYLLNQVIPNEEDKTDSEDEIYDKKEEEEIKKNLKELGYL